MSNPIPVVVLTDSLAEFLARANQWGEANQLLVQAKKNKKPGDGTASPGFNAAQSKSRSLAQWFDMMDDFLLGSFGAGGSQGITVDNRAAPITAGPATAGGGTANFEIDVKRSYGIGLFLSLLSDVASVGLQVDLYSDVARSKLVYSAVSVGVSHVERTPWTAVADDGTDLELTKLYGTVTNNGGSDSTYTIKIIFQG